MDLNPRTLLCQSDECRFNKIRLQSIIVLLLFVAAFGIRLYHIERPPLDFSPIRQYQNAHIARGLYYETNDSISESKKEIARLNMERMGFVLEPRIIENIAVWGYRITGSEHLWIPRVVSSIFWIIGGIYLFLIARMFFTPGAALFSAFFYLFLPYGILASRSFQPDPLMVMMMMFSLYRVLKYDENPTQLNLIIAAAVTAIAVLIKPYCVFIIFGGFYSLAVLRMGFWKASFHRNTIVYGVLISLPTLVYYLLGFLTKGGFLGEHAKGSFLPHLLIYPPFWIGWLTMIGQVVGYIIFFLAVLGLLKLKFGRTKVFLLGLWIGYFIFGLSATYQIHTHNYYTMPFIPIAALSLGPLAAMVIDRRTLLSSMRPGIFIFVFSVIILAVGLGLSKLPLKHILSDYKSELKTAAVFIGVNPEFTKFLRDDFEDKVRISKEIGEYVEHSSKTVFLTPYFGRVLAYHGEIAGLPWPTSRSLYERRLRGVKVPNIKEDFTSDNILILYQGKFVKYTPDYFIITAFDELEKQPDLKDYLNSNFPVLVQSKDYLIFDLMKMSE